jgi:hypothetical protein
MRLRALGIGQQPQIALLADLDRAERGEVAGDELAIEQMHPAQAQRRHQPGQRHFGRIRGSRKHALAAEHPVEADAVEPADQLWCAIGPVAPALDRMRIAGGMQRAIAGGDALADPGFAALGLARRGAGGDHLGKGAVAGDRKPPAPQRPRQGMRAAKAIERQDRAAPRLDPMDVIVVARIGHRKDAAAIGEH